MNEKRYLRDTNSRFQAARIDHRHVCFREMLPVNPAFEEIEKNRPLKEKPIGLKTFPGRVSSVVEPKPQLYSRACLHCHLGPVLERPTVNLSETRSRNGNFVEPRRVQMTTRRSSALFLYRNTRRKEEQGQRRMLGVSACQLCLVRDSNTNICNSEVRGAA